MKNGKKGVAKKGIPKSYSSFHFYILFIFIFM